MGSVFRVGRSHRASFQSCLGSVLLGVVPASGNTGIEPKMVSLGKLTGGTSSTVDPEEVRKVVLQAIQDVKAETGVLVELEAVEYVENDSPRYEKYYSLAHALVLHLAHGG